MNSVERRLKIINMLQSGRSFHISELVSKFDISKRTVYRDINLIQSLGIPVAHETESGYSIIRDGLVPPIMFSIKELSVIMMGLSFIRSQVDVEMKKSAEEVFFKITNALPGNLQSHMHKLEEKILVSPFVHNVDNRTESGDWYTLCEALLSNKPICFSYHDKKGVKSSRIIDPLIMIHYKDHWNVIGYCHHRSDLRNFILSNMRKLVIMKDVSTRSLGYSKKQLLYSFDKEKYEIKVRIQNDISFRFLSELPGLVTKKEIRSKDSVITFVFDNLEFINQWLLQFGERAKPLSPLALLSLRKVLLTKMLAHTKNG